MRVNQKYSPSLRSAIWYIQDSAPQPSLPDSRLSSDLYAFGVEIRPVDTILNKSRWQITGVIAYEHCSRYMLKNAVIGNSSDYHVLSTKIKMDLMLVYVDRQHLTHAIEI
jgi:hypothetical protein